MNTTDYVKPILCDDFDSSRVVTPIKLSKEELLRLSRLNPFLSVYHIVLEWALIIAAALLCQRFWNPVLYAAVIVFIGARQHALLILMHDGTHFRLFPNRYLNDWIAELLLAWPHLATMRTYRYNHLAHHNYTNSQNDPDWTRKQGNPEWLFPQSPLCLIRMFIRDLSGIGGINLIRLGASFPTPDSARSKLFAHARRAYYLVALTIIAWTSTWEAVLLYWVVPYFTWLIFIMRIRSIAEHFALPGGAAAYGHTRTMRIGILERLLLAPKNVNYHLEHHFFPSVPFFRLPQLHSLLLSKREFAAAAHISDSYLSLWRECVR
jgi:fatty acid desaturase